MRPKTAVARRRTPPRATRRVQWLVPALGVVLLAGIGGALWTYWNDSLRYAYPIRYVRIEGKIVQLDEDELSGAIAPWAQAGFFDVDLAAIEAVARSFTWVGDIRVVRQWPDTLIVNVSERRPAARWNRQSLLSDRGERFTPPSTDGFDALPALAGPDGQERELFQVMQKLDAAMRTEGIRVATLFLTARQSWTATLSDGKEIVVGRQEPVASVERVLRWLPGLQRRRGALVRKVDLRYRNGFAVVWGREIEPEPVPPVDGKATGAGTSIDPVAKRPNTHLAAVQW